MTMRLLRPRWLGVALLVIALLVINVVLTHNSLTARAPGMNDFLSRWEGARSFWVDGASPYSDEASLNIQQRIYGRAAEPGEDLGLFAYPMYTALLMLPLVWMPYAWASAVWLVVLEACLIAGFAFALMALRWRPPLLLTTALLVFMLLNYYSFRGLILGQVSHVVFFLTMLTLWGLSRGRDGLAGVALAISTIKPQMGFLLVPFLLLWALRTGRWRFISAFAAMFAALMLLSFALEPAWMQDWIAQVRLYPSYTRDGSPVWILLEFFWGLPVWVGYVVRALLVGWMLWGWWSVLVQRHEDRFLWVVALTLAITHTAGPRTATPHFVVFVLVLLVMMQQLSWRGFGAWNYAILLTLLIVPWWHFFATLLPPNLENLSVFLPPMVLVLLVLGLTRKQWWARPLIFSGSVDRAAA